MDSTTSDSAPAPVQSDSPYDAVRKGETVTLNVPASIQVVTEEELGVENASHRDGARLLDSISLRGKLNSLTDQMKILKSYIQQIQRDIDFPHNIQNRREKCIESINETRAKLELLERERELLDDMLDEDKAYARLNAYFDEYEACKAERAAIVAKIGETQTVETNTAKIETLEGKIKKIAASMPREKLQELLADIMAQKNKAE